MIKESERCKNAYVAAVETRETKLEMEVDANREACKEYVAEIERLEQCGRRIWEILDNLNMELWSSDILPEIGLKAAFEYEEEGSFDGTVHSIPSRGEDVSYVTSVSRCTSAGRSAGAGDDAIGNADLRQELNNLRHQMNALATMIRLSE